MLKYKELYDYIVSVLYELKRKGQTGFFSLSEIVDNLNYPATPSDIYDIGKYLEAEGYAKANFNLGDAYVEITPQGIVYIENKEESFLPTFEEFLQKKAKHAEIGKVASKLSDKSLVKSRKPIVEKISNIVQYLNSHAVYRNSDFHKDAKILKLEIEKINPDKEVVIMKLINLEQLSTIKQQTNEVRDFIDYYISRH
ncbi:hypothetical protein [Dinghuibacter silviterrae]|uniref:Uncharacterized protein n=1 Tax=Dinghuibacter silviterrae TaxID=1539049 RepID=A0A4R8DY94_9BACT|nr:hypothetical protein [Dinghuibacter silviterrae]TDX02191.1 hypothetical protein EDB95_3242 [Dinghuibacter silviterrae]